MFPSEVKLTGISEIDSRRRRKETWETVACREMCEIFKVIARHDIFGHSINLKSET